MAVKLQKPELIALLEAELLKLDKLCVQFDAGNLDLIQDIAQTINHLLHNTDDSKALVNQLKINHLPFYCSAEFYNPKSLINYLGLLKLERNPELGWNYYPKLNQKDLKPVSQENWWQNKKVIIDSLGISYTRNKIVKAMAQGIDDFKLDTSGWKTIGKPDIKIKPMEHSVRQIAFEILESFKGLDINKESKLHYK